MLVSLNNSFICVLLCSIPGNMNNLMQMLTENIDDVITAVLNQLGTQGGPPPMTQQLVDAIPSRPATSEMIGTKSLYIVSSSDV